jgi:hypothetical protein
MPRSIVDEIREIIAQAKPANGNQFDLRLAPQKRVDELLAQLNKMPVRDTLDGRNRSIAIQNLANLGVMAKHLKSTEVFVFYDEFKSA